MDSNLTATTSLPAVVRRKLRVVFARNPPDAFANCLKFPTIDPEYLCPFPGWTIEVLKMISDAMHVDIEPVVSPNVVGGLDWGTYNNSQWKGVLGYLENNTADTACLMYQLTDLRGRYFQFSYPVTNVQPIFVVRRQVKNLSSVLWNAFKPFTYEVWLCFLASLILNMLWMIVVSRVEVSLSLRRIFRPFEMAWQVIQLQLDERSDEMVFESIAGNILMFTFALLQSGFMIELYKGILLTALITSGNENPFQDADGMIKLIGEGKFHLTTNYLGNWYFDDLRNSNEAHFVKLRAATEHNAVVEAASVSAALDLVDKGNYIYPIQQDSLAMQMSLQRCNYIYVSKGLPEVSAYFVFKNDTPLFAEFNHQIIMQQTFIQRTFSKYFLKGYKLGPMPKCDSTEFEETEATKPLDMSSTFGIFTVGGLGIGISIVGFFVEIYHYWHQRLLARRGRTHAALNVANLLNIARVHFTTTQNYNDVDVMKLVEVLNQSSQPNSCHPSTEESYASNSN